MVYTRIKNASLGTPLAFAVDRYEDTILVPGQTVSAGLCLKSFVVATTDENYEPQFVDRTKSSTLHVKVRYERT